MILTSTCCAPSTLYENPPFQSSSCMLLRKCWWLLIRNNEVSSWWLHFPVRCLFQRWSILRKFTWERGEADCFIRNFRGTLKSSKENLFAKREDGAFGSKSSINQNSVDLSQRRLSVFHWLWRSNFALGVAVSSCLYVLRQNRHCCL